MELTCPKCRAAMRTYERGGISVDQCTECRGIFLDRGELEHLIDAEAAYNRGPAPGPMNPAAPAYGSPVPQSQQPPPQQYRRYDSDRGSKRYDSDRGYKRHDSDRPGYKRYDSDRPYPSGGHGSGYGSGYGGRRKKSFLEQLFD